MSNKTLTQALASAQGKIENAPLNKVNPHFKSKYADLAAIRDAVIPALSSEGIAVTQTFQVHEYGPVLVTTLHYGEESIESICPLAVGNTYKPQEFGSAATYARRYALAAIVGIAAEEDDDANAAQDAAKKAPPAKTTAKRAPAKDEQTPQERAHRMCAAVDKCDTPDALEKLKARADFAAAFNELPDEQQEMVRTAMMARRDVLYNQAA